MKDITDFSAKDSKEYNTSMMLFAESGDTADRELTNFQETLYCQEDIPTRLNKKTHNSKHFLDEDYLIGKKMNADTSAIKELTEELKYGSTEEDLDAEITDGGVATEIAEVLATHGITGKAVKDTFDKVEAFFGKDPDTTELAGGESDEMQDDFEDEEVPEEATENEEPVEDEEPEPVEESLQEKLDIASKMFKKTIAEKSLRSKLASSKLDESEDKSECNIVELVEDASCGDFEVIASNDHEVFVVQDFDNYSEEEVEEFEGISWYDYKDNIMQSLDEDSEILDVQLRDPTEAEIEKYYKDYDPDNCVFTVFVFKIKK